MPSKMTFFFFFFPRRCLIKRMSSVPGSSLRVEGGDCHKAEDFLKMGIGSCLL